MADSMEMQTLASMASVKSRASRETESAPAETKAAGKKAKSAANRADRDGGFDGFLKTFLGQEKKQSRPAETNTLNANLAKNNAARKKAACPAPDKPAAKAAKLADGDKRALRRSLEKTVPDMAVDAFDVPPEVAAAAEEAAMMIWNLLYGPTDAALPGMPCEAAPDALAALADMLGGLGKSQGQGQGGEGAAEALTALGVAGIDAQAIQAGLETANLSAEMNSDAVLAALDELLDGLPRDVLEQALADTADALGLPEADGELFDAIARALNAEVVESSSTPAPMDSNQLLAMLDQGAVTQVQDATARPETEVILAETPETSLPEASQEQGAEEEASDSIQEIPADADAVLLEATEQPESPAAQTPAETEEAEIREETENAEGAEITEETAPAERADALPESESRQTPKTVETPAAPEPKTPAAQAKPEVTAETPASEPKEKVAASEQPAVPEQPVESARAAATAAPMTLEQTTTAKPAPSADLPAEQPEPETPATESDHEQPETAQSTATHDTESSPDSPAIAAPKAAAPAAPEATPEADAVAKAETIDIPEAATPDQPDQIDATIQAADGRQIPAMVTAETAGSEEPEPEIIGMLKQFLKEKSAESTAAPSPRAEAPTTPEATEALTEEFADWILKNSNSSNAKELAADKPRLGQAVAQVLDGTDRADSAATTEAESIFSDSEENLETPLLSNPSKGATSPTLGQDGIAIADAVGVRSTAGDSGANTASAPLPGPAVAVATAQTAAPAMPQSAASTTSSMFEQIENIERMAEAVRMANRGGVKNLTLQLTPPELGKVMLKVESRNGVVNAYLRVEKPEAASQLANNLSQLRENLKAQGIELGELDIRQQQQGQALGDFGGQRQRRNQEADADGRGSNSRRGGQDDDDEAEDIAARPSATRRDASGGLNFFA